MRPDFSYGVALFANFKDWWPVVIRVRADGVCVQHFNPVYEAILLQIAKRSINRYRGRYAARSYPFEDLICCQWAVRPSQFIQDASRVRPWFWQYGDLVAHAPYPYRFRHRGGEISEGLLMHKRNRFLPVLTIGGERWTTPIPLSQQSPLNRATSQARMFVMGPE